MKTWCEAFSSATNPRILDQLSSTVCFSSASSLADDWIQTSLFRLPASLIMQLEHSNLHMKLNVSVGLRWSCLNIFYFLHFTPNSFHVLIQDPFCSFRSLSNFTKKFIFPDVSQAAWPHQNRNRSQQKPDNFCTGLWLTFSSEVHMSWKKMDCRIKQSVKLVCLLGLRVGWIVLCSCKQFTAGYKDDGLPHFSTITGEQAHFTISNNKDGQKTHWK